MLSIVFHKQVFYLYNNQGKFAAFAFFCVVPYFEIDVSTVNMTSQCLVVCLNFVCAVKVLIVIKVIIMVMIMVIIRSKKS